MIAVCLSVHTFNFGDAVGHDLPLQSGYASQLTSIPVSLDMKRAAVPGADK